MKSNEPDKSPAVEFVVRDMATKEVGGKAKIRIYEYGYEYELEIKYAGDYVSIRRRGIGIRLGGVEAFKEELRGILTAMKLSGMVLWGGKWKEMRKIPHSTLIRYYKIVSKSPEGWIYECKLCGERMEKRMLRWHLKYKHPVEWIMLVEEEAESDEDV